MKSILAALGMLVIFVGIPVFVFWVLLWGPCWLVRGCDSYIGYPNRCIEYCEMRRIDAERRRAAVRERY